MNKKFIIVMILTIIMMVGLVSASSVTTDRLNYYESEQHTVNISNTLGASANAVATMPTGFAFVSSTSGCTNPSGQEINCNSIASSGSAVYIISSPSSGTEYSLSTLNTTLNATSLNDVNFINIKNGEIQNSLIEFGRGKGNYFYNSYDGTASSAGTGLGYNYVPNGTGFELNYLHKIFNIKQYFGLASSRATDVSFSCEYPFGTIIRQHMVETISNDGSTWTLDYSIPRIDGSWERMSFVGQDFDAGEYDVGDTFVINCTNLDYNLADAYGHIKVDEDSFDMEVRSPNPLSLTASSDTATIGNGTSEVILTYVITNDEVYPVDAVMLEIEAPELGSFIGVRGEMWGTSQDRYVQELTSLSAGESITISLLARFDTSLSSDTTLDLTQGVQARFIPTWELNSYNPMAYNQPLSLSETLTVNYGLSSSIIGLQSQITRIETNTVVINTTVNDIYDIVTAINSSMLTLETADGDILNAINNSRNTIIDAINSSDVVPTSPP